MNKESDNVAYNIHLDDEVAAMAADILEYYREEFCIKLNKKALVQMCIAFRHKQIKGE